MMPLPPLSCVKSLTQFTTSAILCATFFSTPGHADILPLEMTANILNGTCKMAITNNGAIDLGIVGPGYFRNAITPDQYQGGGAPFSIQVQNCNAGADTNIKNLHIIFAPRSGTFAPGTTQVFPNETPAASGGAQNVGVTIFTVEDGGSVKNVRDAAGHPRADYRIINNLTLDNSVYHFYSRFQQTGANPVIPGKVTSMVLVDVYYD